ncbi:MAG: two pore domain potassium channel family protein [Bacteroidetes bacterium]|nr:two pore domain potassium channel family protein [Bacteroidota bacterium]
MKQRPSLLITHVEIILWFASSYLVLYPHFQVAYTDTVFNAIYASFRVTTNLGLDSVEALTNLGRNLLWVQSISGLLITIISIARFINVLPIPDTDDPIEKSKK